MAWMDVPFPPGLAFGLQCDPEWDVNITTTRAGWESRNLNWVNARHNYDAAFATRTADAHKLVRAHFHMARGSFHSWPLLDPLDHDCTLDEGFVQATATTGVFQLFKRYGDGDFAYDRKITRPSQVMVFSSDMIKTEGVDYTLDLTTGLLTFAGGDATLIGWEGIFYVPCRYDTNKLPAQVIDREKGGGRLFVSSSGLPIVEVRE